MKKTFFARRAVPILMVVFFMAPIALRGARLAVQRLRNDVKDWLPADFDETSQLDWFREHFLGEQFVVASWKGCTGETDDTRFRMLVDKFFPEVPPSQRKASSAVADEGSSAHEQYIDKHLGLYVRQKRPEDGGQETIGDRLGLYTVGYHNAEGALVHPYENWGHRNEKWLKGHNDQWHFILPNGDLYRWNGGTMPITSGLRAIRRWLVGEEKVQGELVARLGPKDGPWYYQDPRRLEAPLFKSVVTGPAVLHQLTTQEPIEVDVTEAKKRLEGVLFGPDGKQTCLLITLTDAGKADMRRAVGRGLLGKPRGKLLDLAEESGIHVPTKPSLVPPPFSWLLAKAPPALAPEIRMGGPAIDNVAIDEEGQVTLVRLVGLSVVLGVGLTWVSFRSFYVTVMVLIVGGLSAIVSLSIVWWSGSSVDAVLMSMPSLVYVLGLSGAVHIVNYYREAVHASGLRGAPERAVGVGWQPCTLAAVTTGVGLLSLTTAKIVPIQKFGFFSAVGVVATLVLLFTYLPSALELWPPGFMQRSKDPRVGSRSADHGVAIRIWRVVGHFVIRHHGAVTASFLLIMAFFAVGLTKINTSIQLLKLFHRDAKIIQDYTWLEANLGNLVPMELVVRVDPAVMRFDRQRKTDGPRSGTDQRSRHQLNFLERMEITENIHRVIDKQFGADGQGVVGHAMLAATFAPPLPATAHGWQSAMERGTVSRRLEAHRREFLASDYFRSEKGTGAELWRVSLRLKALSDIDYGQFVNELKSVVEPVMAAYRCREQIIRVVDDPKNPRQFSKSRVYLVGTAFNQREAAAGNDPPAGDKPPPPIPTWQRAETQTATFTHVLSDLLKNAGLTRVFGGHFARPLPDDWLDHLSPNDCVVLVNEDPQYRVAALRRHTSRVIDATHHGFDPTSPAPTAYDHKEHIATVYTGVVPVVYKAQRTLLHSLIRSTIWAFAGIALVMIIVVRSPSAGLISMIPNVFPVILIFGYMGWRDVVVDIGSMMCASVAMGVAVDDTIHFWTWFKRGLDSGLDRLAAIMMAYKRCATAMTQTTLIGGLGLSVFAFSTFTPTQRFGILMLVLMAAALVGDLILLPAILAGPLGRVFARRVQSRAAPKPTGAHRQPLPATQGPHGGLSSQERSRFLDGRSHRLRTDGAHDRLRRS